MSCIKFKHLAFSSWTNDLNFLQEEYNVDNLNWGQIIYTDQGNIGHRLKWHDNTVPAILGSILIFLILLTLSWFFFKHYSFRFAVIFALISTLTFPYYEIRRMWHLRGCVELRALFLIMVATPIMRVAGIYAAALLFAVAAIFFSAHELWTAIHMFVLFISSLVFSIGMFTCFLREFLAFRAYYYYEIEHGPSEPTGFGMPRKYSC